ncbi:glycosyltransferase family 2 protein [Halobaculum lipolyticum]|uniref:Glycosyltransferase family 2 protein n=1 Tax=Halobaculum lipolyticum TaxID=3032001 RepID=A0ABD5W8V2_9EURY|nr:glycosyltransferase family 2 protein [Halobaculum sp. DT31]
MSRASGNGSTVTENPFDDWELTTPVALMVYDRPEHTARVFERIADAEPPTLLVVADGPKPGDERDRERCRETRAVTEDVDWDCTVHREYAETNMGIKERFQSGLDWVFDTVDEAIILEDDCLPNRSFFRFIEEMLDEYRDDERVMDVCGSNHLGSWKENEQDYHFTRYGGIWGWGTWADRWELCRQEMDGWEDADVRDLARGYWGGGDHWRYNRNLYSRTDSGRIVTWDYQWGFTRAVNWGLTVVPSKNLVSNIGFGEAATNTTTTESEMSSVPTSELEFPLTRRGGVGSDAGYDEAFYRLTTSVWDRHLPLQLVKNLYNDLTR